MNIAFALLALVATSWLPDVTSQNPNYPYALRRHFRRDNNGNRIRRQTNADQMVQNILQWLQGVYTQNSRKIRQGTVREYLPPVNTEKPRPFEPHTEPPEDNTIGYPSPPPGVYPPVGPGPTQPEQPQEPGYPSEIPGGEPGYPGSEIPGGEPGYSTPEPPGGEPGYPGYPGGEVPGYPGSEPPGKEPGYPESGEPGQKTTESPGVEIVTEPQGPGYPGQKEPGYPGTEQPGYPGGEQPGYPGGEQPGYPGGEQPGYPGGEQPGYPGGEQPGYPGTEQPGYPRTEQPGYPGSEEPGYPRTEQPGYPGPEQPTAQPPGVEGPEGTEPGYPGQEQPTQPEPEGPSQPEEPEGPGQPEEPKGPGQPQIPGYPGPPEVTTQPEGEGYPPAGQTPIPPFGLPGQTEPSPEQPEPTPGQPELTPGQPELTPEQPEPTPGQPEPGPEQPELTPGEPEPSPGEPEPSPGQPEPSPGQPEPTPEQPEPSPGEPEPSPGQPEPTPGQPELGYPEVSETEKPEGPEGPKPGPTEGPQGPEERTEPEIGEGTKRPEGGEEGGYPPAGQTPAPSFELPTITPSEQPGPGYEPGTPGQTEEPQPPAPAETEGPKGTEKPDEVPEPGQEPGPEPPGQVPQEPGPEPPGQVPQEPEVTPEQETTVSSIISPSGTTELPGEPEKIPVQPGVTTEQPIPQEPGKPSEPSEEEHPPHIHALNVVCDQDKMTITVEFNREFNGIIYSKGNYNDPDCRYVSENSGQTKYEFTVFLNQCGTELISPGNGEETSYLENVLVMQNEVGIQEVWDTVRAVRCQWEQSLKKSLTTSLSVGMLSPEIVTFSGDSIMARLDIQQGEGPFAPTANGLVPIGEKMTLVVTVTGANDYDIQVKDCRAKDTEGKNEVLLSDENGCILKPKLFGAFQKSSEPAGPILAYAFFNAFKFPDIMDLLIECNVELCKDECEMCPDPNQKLRPGRRRRDVGNNTLTDPVRVGKLLRVLLPEDLSNSEAIIKVPEESICISIKTFVLTTTFMISLLTSAAMFTAYIYMKSRRSHHKH